MDADRGTLVEAVVVAGAGDDAARRCVARYREAGRQGQRGPVDPAGAELALRHG
ncbi:hypothetical protein CSC33_2179 [Pseudomonas aeruginosa]|nr:hypothetical protein CSC33_2179 [Pseudomonas aeruginosa]